MRNFPASGAKRQRTTRTVNASAAPDAKLAWEIGMLLGRARRLMILGMQRQFEAEGRSVHTWRALNQLERLGCVVQCELAQAMAQHPGATSRALDELEADGLVRRRRDARDRRKLWVELTARGHSQYEAMRPLALRVLGQLMAPLSAADRRCLSRLLAKLAG